MTAKGLIEYLKKFPEDSEADETTAVNEPRSPTQAEREQFWEDRDVLNIEEE